MAKGFDLQGHRGARGLYPENTLDGFRQAIARGVTRFELDVGISRDGVPVVHHDVALNPDVARDGSGAWVTAPAPLLRDLTLTELRRYDVGRLRPGSRYAANFPEQRPQDGARIPTLEEVLRLDPSAFFTLELKLPADRPEATVAPEDMAERVAALVEALGVQSRIAVSSFNWRAQRHMRRLLPGVDVAFLTEPKTVEHAALWWDGTVPPGGSVPAAVAAEGGPTWQPQHESLTEAALAEARRLSLRVVPWTVNRPEDMDRLIAWGVEGFITDRPDLGLEAARRAGLALAA